MARPIEQQIAAGNPYHRKDMSPSTVRNIPTVSPVHHVDLPEHIGTHGTQMVRQITEHAFWIAKTDLPALIELAELEDLKFELRDKVREDISHFNKLLDLYKHQNRLIERLGLTPTDRSKLGLARVEAEVKKSKLDQFKEKTGS